MRLFEGGVQCLRAGNDDYCFEVRDDGQYNTDRMKESVSA